MPYNAQLTQHFDCEVKTSHFPILILRSCSTLNCNQPFISSSLLRSRDWLTRLPFTVFTNLTIFSPQEIASSSSFSSTRYVSIIISVFFTIIFFFCSFMLISKRVRVIFFREFSIYRPLISFDVWAVPISIRYLPLKLNLVWKYNYLSFEHILNFFLSYLFIFDRIPPFFSFTIRTSLSIFLFTILVSYLFDFFPTRSFYLILASTYP